MFILQRNQCQLEIYDQHIERCCSWVQACSGNKESAVNRWPDGVSRGFAVLHLLQAGVHPDLATVDV